MGNPFERPEPFKTLGQKSNTDAHANADTDADRGAIHHTLGSGPLQAAPGSHKHSDYVVKAGQAGNWTPNVRNFNDTALAHTLELAKFKVVDEVCTWWLNVTINANGTNFVKFDTPVPMVNLGALQYPIGHGRENISGNMCQVLKHAAGVCAVILYNNGNTAVNGNVLLLAGSYLTNPVP